MPRRRIAFVALVGGADQEQLVPRQNEERPVVGAGLDVHTDARRAGERRHDDVAAFRAADQARVLNRTQHLVDPRPRRVDDQRRTRAARAAHGLPLDARHAAALDADARHARVSREHGPIRDGIAHVLDDEPLRIAHLRVVIARTADEAVRLQPRHLREQLVARERSADSAATCQPTTNRRAPRPTPICQRPAPRTAVNRNAQLERLDEMRREREQPLALAQRLVHEPELEMLEVPQPAMNQPRRSAAGAHADVAAFDEQRLDPAERRLARNRRAVDPGADHDQLVRTLRLAACSCWRAKPAIGASKRGAGARQPFRHRREYVPVGCVGDVHGADAAERAAHTAATSAVVVRGLSDCGRSAVTTRSTGGSGRCRARRTCSS